MLTNGVGVPPVFPPLPSSSENWSEPAPSPTPPSHGQVRACILSQPILHLRYVPSRHTSHVLQVTSRQPILHSKPCFCPGTSMDPRAPASPHRFPATILIPSVTSRLFRTPCNGKAFQYDRLLCIGGGPNPRTKIIQFADFCVGKKKIGVCLCYPPSGFSSFIQHSADIFPSFF